VAKGIQEHCSAPCQFGYATQVQQQNKLRGLDAKIVFNTGLQLELYRLTNLSCGYWYSGKEPAPQRNFQLAKTKTTGRPANHLEETSVASCQGLPGPAAEARGRGPGRAAAGPGRVRLQVDSELAGPEPFSPSEPRPLTVGRLLAAAHRGPWQPGPGPRGLRPLREGLRVRISMMGAHSDWKPAPTSQVVSA
jgi:hypothetical protein